MAVTTDPPIKGGVLESLSRALGDYVTNREIDRLLPQSKLVDLGPGTKWERIYSSFVKFQNQYQVSNNILLFVQNAINPHRFVQKEAEFEEALIRVNSCLLFIGRELLPTGKLRKVEAANTISEAQRRASNLLQKLKDRRMHDEVLRFCKAELLADNYFHAVFEATKSVAQRIRDLSGSGEDGSALVESVFTLYKDIGPVLAINNLVGTSEQSEQKGFVNLLKGMFSMFRNPAAHEPRIHWTMQEDDALDILGMTSLIHRKLDNTTKRRPV